MKTKLIILLAVLMGTFSTKAQDPECMEKLSIVNELCKAKEFATAAPTWEVLYKKCPSIHIAVYIRGEQILKDKIDNAKTKDEKTKIVRELVKMYEDYDKYFPNNNKGNTVKKATALFDNNVGTSDEVYQLLDHAFKNDLKNFDNPRALYLYFEIFVNDFNAGKKNYQLQDVFTQYDVITDKLELEKGLLSESIDAYLKKQEAGESISDKETRSFTNDEINYEAFNTVIGSMDGITGELSTCERLIPFIKGDFEKNKGNAEWLRRAADRLNYKGCSTDPIFAKIAEALHQLNPTAKSAYNLGVAAYNGRNTSKALEFFNQSAELQKDSNEKAKVYYQIATSIYGASNKAQAKNFLKKALAVKPSFGSAYLYLASLYASSANDCGSTPFEKRATYWVAARTARRAGEVDSTVRSNANAAAASYDKLAPSRTDIFNEGMQGKTISLRCWIGESVTVPNL